MKILSQILAVFSSIIYDRILRHCCSPFYIPSLLFCHILPSPPKKTFLYVEGLPKKTKRRHFSRTIMFTRSVLMLDFMTDLKLMRKDHTIIRENYNQSFRNFFFFLQNRLYTRTIYQKKNIKFSYWIHPTDKLLCYLLVFIFLFKYFSISLVKSKKSRRKLNE